MIRPAIRYTTVSLALLVALAAGGRGVGAAPLAGPGGLAAHLDITPNAIGGIDFRLPATERLILTRDVSVRFELVLAVPESDLSGRNGLGLRPTGSSTDLSGEAVTEVRPAGLESNNRATGFVPWLETLYVATGDARGFAGTYGPHSKWSNEIDQWIAGLNAIDGLGTR